VIKSTFCNLMEMWSMAPTFIIAYSKNEKMGLSYCDINTGTVPQFQRIHYLSVCTHFVLRSDLET
jgi:hypothetical protein